MSPDLLSQSQIKMLQQKSENTYSDNNHINSFIVFWLYVIKKIIFSLISVKLWAFVGTTWVNFWLVVEGYINGSNFAAIQICLISTVLVAREYSKHSHNSAVDKIVNNPIVEKLSDVINKKDTQTSEELDD